MEYIDKAKLMAKIESEYREWGEDYDAYQILGDIEDFPVDDVAPVVHAKWEKKDFYTRVCSACGFAIDMGTDSHFLIIANYCPSCGAKME